MQLRGMFKFDFISDLTSWTSHLDGNHNAFIPDSTAE